MPRYWRDIKMLEAASGVCAKCGKQLHSRKSTYCQRCLPRTTGEKSQNWRGGRTNVGKGYRQIYIGRVNGKTQYKLEHHLVWEQTHKRPLPKGYLVHHLNGIKDDNRPENLVAILRNKHSVWTLVELAQVRIRQLEQLHLNLP